MDSHHFTKFENGFVRKISEDNIIDDTWILTDLDTKSPVVVVDGHECLLKPGWVASDGLVYGEPFRRPKTSRNVHALYGSLPNTKARPLSVNMSSLAYGGASQQAKTSWSREFTGMVFNETMTQIRCDGTLHHDWKTYNSGFTEYQYCSVCDRKKGS